MNTPITDSKAIYAYKSKHLQVVPTEWARELEIDVKILFYRLLCEPEDSHSPETLEVMRKWAGRLEKEVRMLHPYLKY